jgi:hypothetical protein
MAAALVAVIVAGSALRLWQYGANGSLWVDELALARGILAADLRELLTTPLLHNQVAPKGFLLVVKLAVSAFGPSEYALRLFPLLCSLISLVAFVRLSARLLGGVGPLAASALFATATPLVASAALVKQYSAEVCVAVLLWQLAYGLSTRTVTPQRAAPLGALLVWFSNPAALMAAALGTALLMWPGSGSNEGGRRRELWPVLACWWASSVAAIVATFVTTTQATRDYMRWFWAGGFAPSAPAEFLKTLWPLERVSSLFGQGQIFDGMGYPLPAVYAALALLGLAWLWRRDKCKAALLTAPLLFTLAAAVFRLYPFRDRLVHFLLPGLLLAIAAAVECVRKLLWHRSRVLGTLAAALLLLPAVYPLAATPPPYYTEPIKPVLAYLRERRHPGDAVYIYYGAALAVTFYAPQYDLRREEYAVGGCHRGESRLYLQELDTLRGRPRVWVLLTHAGPVLREREDILSYLDVIGVRQEGVVVEPHGIGRNLYPAEAYLYDLSNSEKLGAVVADTFQLKGPHAPGERLGCGEGTQAALPVDFR